MAVEPLLRTRAQRAFMITIILQAIVVLTMVAIVFRFVEEHVDLKVTRYKTVPCYLALFALSEIFELGMAFDALRLRNVIQLAGILIFHAALIVMAALQVHQTHTALVNGGECAAGANTYVTCGGAGSLWRKVLPFLIVVPCVLAAAWLAIMFWVRALYAEFGWAIFHVVGANPKMKTMYQYYQVMVCLLKFDFFAFTGVTMQLLILVLSTSSAEFGVTVAAIPVVLCLLAACGFALRREIKWLMTVSLVLMLAAMGYFVYKLVRFYQPGARSAYVSTRATLTIFTISAFMLLLCSFLVGIKCFSDFDLGLRESKSDDTVLGTSFLGGLPSPGKGNMTMNQRQSSYMGGAPVTQRISIE